MIIRPERSGDRGAILAVIASAFVSQPHSSGTESSIVDALTRAGALSLSLVAEARGDIVGHIAFSPVIIGGGSAGWFALAPLSVEPTQWRRGIGGALVQEGLKRLRAAGAEGCVVLGDPRYYGRFGFVPDVGLRYREVPPGYLQRLPFSDSEPAGEVAFHPAFDAA